MTVKKTLFLELCQAFAEELTLDPSCLHTLKWRYQKDSSGSGGQDCVWIDKVQWTPKVPTWSTMYANASDRVFMVANYFGSPVTQYYFECLTEGGHDSGWQGSWYYTDTGLASGQTYRYRVKGRDSSQNETGWSEVKSATTTGTLGTPAEQYAPDWANITYTYDAAGRRITKDVDCMLTKYIYDGDHVIAEYGTDGELLRKYIYGPGTDNPVCMIEVAESNAKYYYHRDGLGNVVALSDDSGDTVQTYEYTIYGQVAASDPNHPNPYMFTGRRFEPETGLYYYRARIYNPYIGRFLQTDPIGYSDGINWYAYCGNNPGNLVDPMGLTSSTSGSELIYVYDWRWGWFWELSDEEVLVNNTEWETWSWNKDEIAVEIRAHPNDIFEHEFAGWGTGYIVHPRAEYCVTYYPYTGGDYPTPGHAELISKEAYADGTLDGKDYALWCEADVGLVSTGDEIFFIAPFVNSVFAPMMKTVHGLERIAGQGATRGGALSERQIRIVNARACEIYKTQSGATVRVLEVEAGKFNLTVQGSNGGYVTSYYHLRRKTIDHFATRFGYIGYKK